MKNLRIAAWFPRAGHGALVALALLAAMPETAAQEPPPPALPGHYRIGLAVKPLGPRAQSGLVLSASSATRIGREIRLRVAFRNVGKKTFGPPFTLYEEDIRIIGAKTYRRQPIGSISKQLLAPIPKAGLPPGLSMPGEIVFEAESDETTEFELQVTDFGTLKFKLDEERKFSPPPGGLAAATAAPRLRLDAVEPKLGVVDLHVHALHYDGVEFGFRVGFRNAGRAAVKWRGPLNASAARFLDTEGSVHAPAGITGDIQESIGPVGRAWKVGEEVSGTITFRGIHPHGAREGRLVFPGFPPVHLSWDAKNRTYKAKPVEAPEGAAGNSGVDAEQKRFEELVAFFEGLNQRIAKGDRIGYLMGFSDIGHLRARQTKLLETFESLPVKNLRYEVPGNQNIVRDADGGSSNVTVVLRYHFDGIADDNVFRTLLKCDFVRHPKSGKLLIRAQRTAKYPPFWSLGYTAFEATDHFLIFYRPGTVSADLLGTTTRQVEASYRELARRKLPMEKRYVAFFLPYKEDFIAFTGRDPNLFSGVAATFFEEEDGKFLTGNRAMYINDHRFLVEQRTWGMRDRQTTITHELVHLALAPATRPYSPAWLVEGVAVNYAGQINPFTQHALGTKGWLPRLDLASLSLSPMLGKGAGNPDEITMQYYLSGEAVALLRKKFGDDKLLAFYRAFGDLGPSEVKTFIKGRTVGPRTLPEIGIRLTEHLVANHFGMSLEELDAEVRENVRRRTKWAR